MKKEELIEEINSMINDETNISVIQSEHFNEDLVRTLWNIKEMVLQLE